MARILTVLIVTSVLIVSFASGSLWDLVARKLYSRGRRQLENTVRDTPDFKNNAIKLIESHGYPAEEHEIQTEDGYLLTMHRIPHSRKSYTRNPPVILHHGLMASSDSWVLRGPKQDLAFILADNGYDVWMCNSRGNFYSRKHVHLDPDRDKRFWKFSFHEIGIYDLPATIDYVLNTTGYNTTFYMGHSMGAMVFFVMESTRPEYNSKVRLMQGLAPAAYIVHRPSPLMKFLISNGPSIAYSLRSQGYYELFPLRRMNSQLGKAFCHQQSPTQPFCLAAIFLFVGIDEQQLNNTFVPVIFDYFPAGASLYQFLHFLQNLISRQFRQMDYGEKLNMIKYNQSISPEYDLRKVTTPVALHYGDGDFLITREDTEMLASKLPNTIGTFRVPFPSFNHLDFIWSDDSKMLLYDQLLTIMNKYR